MNTMKKWVVAGLVGLSSVGVSMATTYLDLNTYGNVTGWDGASIGLTAPGLSGSSEPDTLSLGNGDRNASIFGVGNAPSVAYRTADIAVEGSKLTFAYTRGVSTLSTQAHAGMSILYGMGGDAFAGLIMGDYDGIEIDFQSAADPFWQTALGSGANSYFTITVDDGVTFSTVDLRNHTADPTPFAWNLFSGVSVADIAGIEIRFYTTGAIAANTTLAVSEVISSFRLYDLDGGQGVPEPETVWMMLAVLGSLAVTFRRQLMGMFVKA